MTWVGQMLGRYKTSTRTHLYNNTSINERRFIMKKFLSTLAVVGLVVGAVAACDQTVTEEEQTPVEENQQLQEEQKQENDEQRLDQLQEQQDQLQDQEEEVDQEEDALQEEMSDEPATGVDIEEETVPVTPEQN